MYDTRLKDADVLCGLDLEPTSEPSLTPDGNIPYETFGVIGD